MEIAPFRRRIGARPCEGPGFGSPAGIKCLCRRDFVGRHVLEPVIARIELPDMFEAKPLPLARSIETGTLTKAGGRTEFARLRAAGMGAGLTATSDSSVEFLALHEAGQCQLGCYKGSHVWSRLARN